MKKILILTVVTAILASCTKTSEIEENINVKSRVFTASIECADTRTFLDSNMKLLWTADDRISVFTTTYNQQYKFNGKTGDNNGDFTEVGFHTGNEISTNYAVYPYNEGTTISNDEVITLTLPSVQKYAEGTFGLGANTMVAVTESASSTFLPFKNVCGYLVVKVYGEGTVKSASLRGNNNEKIAGTATVSPIYGQSPSIAMADNATGKITIDCGEGVSLSASSDSPTEFWFCIPPTEFTEGFTVTVTNMDGEIMERNTSASCTIVRNVMNDMPALEAEFVSTATIISARIGGNDTRSAIIDDGYGPSAVWSEKDSITVVDADGIAHICHLKSGAGTVQGVFESKDCFSTDNGQSCYGLFDFSSDGKGGHIWKNDNEYREDIVYNPMVATGISDSNEMVFNPAGCIVKLCLKGVGILGKIGVTSTDAHLGGNVKIGENGNVIVDASGPKTMTMDCGNGLELNENLQKTFYFALPEGDYAGLSFSFIGTNGFFSVKTVEKTLSLIKGHLYSLGTLNLDLSQKISIDLGLSVDWATCNLGASSPLECGDYYAWGEVLPYYREGPLQTSVNMWRPGKTSGYTWTSYTWCNGSNSTLTKYNVNSAYGSVDNNKVLLLSDDAANYNNTSRRIPKKTEWQELKDNCNVKSIVINGIKGVLCTSKVNGNSIFLPAAGLFYGTGLSDVNNWGYYWTSSLYTGWPDNSNLSQVYCAWDVSFSGSLSIGYLDRYYGHTIRAVCP